MNTLFYGYNPEDDIMDEEKRYFATIREHSTKEYEKDLIEMNMIKYYDIHMVIAGDCKEGYSVFVAAGSAEEAIRKIIENELYEDISDIDNIDYIGEITKEEYYSSVCEENDYKTI